MLFPTVEMTSAPNREKRHTIGNGAPTLPAVGLLVDGHPRQPLGSTSITAVSVPREYLVVFMVRTSTPWRLLPARELGCGSPATCWRRLTEWAKAGVFDQLHLVVLDRLGEQEDIPPIRTPSRRRRRRPGKLHADKGTTAKPTVPGCGVVGFGRGSPGVGWTPQRDLGGTAGKCSGRWPG
jgi:transposase